MIWKLNNISDYLSDDVGLSIMIITRSFRARSLVVSDLHSGTKGSRFESGC